MSIELRNIHKSFGKQPLFKDLNLTVNQGELHVLVGPSGEGKSTLLSLIAGLQQPDHGDIAIDDQIITQTPAQKRDIGFVFQDYALFPHLTAEQNIAYGLKASRLDPVQVRERCHYYLALVSLAEEKDKLPSMLSGGQKQRVALARALAIEPRILLLDEPLSHLDNCIREQLQFELKEIQSKTGVTMLLVTHNMTEAVTLGQRISLLKRGAISRTASTNAIV